MAGVSLLRLLPVLTGAWLAGAAAAGDEPTAISLEPSEWLGNDGNWSTVRFNVGSTEQKVNVLVSTSLSEFWVVGSHGCTEDDPHCVDRRGGVFDSSGSTSWSSLGTWALTVQDTGQSQTPANGEYGLDRSVSHDPFADRTLTLPSALIAAVNSSEYFTGVFGLGVTSSSFGDKNNAVEPPLVQAVSTIGAIPSYTYGYTAGAHYKNTPASVTLGGYDESRFTPHSTEFVLSTTDKRPFALVRGIETSAVDTGDVPDDWKSATAVLSNMKGSFNALLDSTTPFLWLPGELCDSFSDAFNLTYNDTFGLYTLTNDQYSTLRDSKFSFTFSLSSIDNTDDLGDPLSVPGVVNITISSAALASTLQYPFMQPAIKYGDPSVPYFPLRRLSDDGVPIIGRSFFQEAYIRTEYDRSIFSIHEAVFPKDPEAVDITSVKQPDDSILPAVHRAATDSSNSDDDSGISSGQVAGIVGAIAALMFGLLVLAFFWQKRRKALKTKAASGHRSIENDLSWGPSPVDRKDDKQRTPADRLFSYIGVKRPGVDTNTKHAAADSQLELDASGISGPVEVANHEVFEMPAGPLPVELDAGNDFGDGFAGRRTGNRDSGTQASRSSTATTAQDSIRDYHKELELDSATGWRPSTDVGSPPLSALPTSPHTLVPSPMVPSPLSPLNCNTPTVPLSAYNRMYTPSPRSAAPSPVPRSPVQSTGGGYHSRTNSDASYTRTALDSPTLTHTTLHTEFNYRNSRRQSPPPLPTLPPVATLPSMRIPITNARALYGLPQEFELPRIIRPDGGGGGFLDGDINHNRQSIESLGSNFTEVEERMHMEQMVRSRSALSQNDGGGPLNLALDFGDQPWDDSVTRPRGNSRADRWGPSGTGILHEELVHIPQPAERKYSWET